jgi:hypothetical protein
MGKKRKIGSNVPEFLEESKRAVAQPIGDEHLFPFRGNSKRSRPEGEAGLSHR